MDNENLTPKEHFQQMKNLTRQHPELFNILYLAANEVMAKSYESICGMYGKCGGYMPGFEAFGPGNSLACDCYMRGKGGRKGQWGSSRGGRYGYAGFDITRKEEPWDSEDQWFMDESQSRGMNELGRMEHLSSKDEQVWNT
ncbi:hypothetical protein OESDEN_16809 [Oesophagostomum dentatum]|uniref:Uncharacterized protein n=1 Tax=Oesophagostomum dentatum TaxID=61180 RepID=A0A0B1SIY9_OESDE|nr:hypothetical protein OESDEN_16809 [Oesophagostomum dentatum]